MTPFTLRDFVRESNRIEGITRPPSKVEMREHRILLGEPVVTVGVLVNFVWHIASADLRDKPGMNVYVGNHHPIPGGPEVKRQLEALLNAAKYTSAYETHRQYEALHPFMDGNGRSGRALWLHQMGGIEGAPIGFLHAWYYSTLAIDRRGPDLSGLGVRLFESQMRTPRKVYDHPAEYVPGHEMGE